MVGGGVGCDAVMGLWGRQWAEGGEVDMEGGISIVVRPGKRVRAGSSIVPSQSLMQGGGIAGEADGLLHAGLLSFGSPLCSAWWCGGPGAWWCGGPDITQPFSR